MDNATRGQSSIAKEKPSTAMMDTSSPIPIQAPVWQYTTQPVDAGGMIIHSARNSAVTPKRSVIRDPTEYESVSINVDLGKDHATNSHISSIIAAKGE